MIIPCLVCGGDNKQGCPACNGAGVHTVSDDLPEGQPGFIARKGCGCAVDWCGDGISPQHLAARRALWESLGHTIKPAPWTAKTSLALTDGAACAHAPVTAPPAAAPIRITRVEMAHCAVNSEDSITHVMLHVRLEDGTWRMVEIPLPGVDAMPVNQPEGP